MIGGSLAMLGGLDMSILAMKMANFSTGAGSRRPPHIMVYSFGMPRTGNDSLRRVTLAHLPHFYRIYNSTDVMPSMPASRSRYYHCGQGVCLYPERLDKANRHLNDVIAKVGYENHEYDLLSITKTLLRHNLSITSGHLYYLGAQFPDNPFASNRNGSTMSHVFNRLESMWKEESDDSNGEAGSTFLLSVAEKVGSAIRKISLGSQDIIRRLSNAAPATPRGVTGSQGKPETEAVSTTTAVADPAPDRGSIEAEAEAAVRLTTTQSLQDMVDALGPGPSSDLAGAVSSTTATTQPATMDEDGGVTVVIDRTADETQAGLE